MNPTRPDPSPALQAHLRGAGYEIVFRAAAWIECLVARADERWLGRGTTEVDALRRMLPSHLARVLLATELRSWAGGAEATPDEPDHVDAEALDVSASQPADEVPSAPAPEPSSAQSADEVPGPKAEPRETSGDAAPPPEAPARETTHTASTATVEPEPARATGPDVHEVLDALDELLREIEHRLADFALLAAERQRLELLTWICRARGVGEALPSDRDVEVGVARVARRLGEIAKTFWPGSVGALQLAAQPDLIQELRGRGPAPQTWTAAAARAQHVLATQETQDRANGMDEHGWACAVGLTSRPPEPDAALEEITRELVARLGAGEPTDARLAQLQDADLEALTAAAWRLRSLRGTVRAPLAWGAVLGRLRRLVHVLGQRAPGLRAALDARTRPSTPVVVDLPASFDGPEQLVIWIVRAFDAMPTPDVAMVLAERHVDVAVLESAVEAQTDRRLRRRLRELVRRLRAATANDGPPIAPAESQEAAVPSLAGVPEAREDDSLAGRVRARTQGQRALFVSNREDRELEEKLTEVLGMAITWCDGSQRKVQAQRARLAKGGFDIVLCASGFQSHSVDVALAKAAQLARVPYVRVNRGRAVACVQAIAREFGLLAATPGRAQMTDEVSAS
jgi:hypothetical protein